MNKVQSKVIVKQLLNIRIKSLLIPTLACIWLFFPFFACATQPSFDSKSKYYDRCLKKSNIIHITTEFLDAKAGGLGAVVNEVVTLQASQGHNVTVILPWLQNDDNLPAYKFLDISNSVNPPQEIKIVIGSSLIEALVYEYNISMGNKQIRLKAIKPVGEFSYLTKIKSSSNPYILSDNSVRMALDLWQKHDVAIAKAKNNIEEKIKELNAIDAKIKNICNELAKTKNTAALRMQIEDLEKSRKRLLLTKVTDTDISLEGVFFKISNEKSYILAYLAAVLVKEIAFKENIDFIHAHHFGHELKLLKKLLYDCRYPYRYPIMIKSLHSLNTKLTHLDGRENPVVEGIAGAHGVHVVSPGSFQELQDDIVSKRYVYPESSIVDLNWVFVATNGINHEKFSLTQSWIDAKKNFPAELNSFPDTIEDLDLYEQKQLFKKALMVILPNLVRQNKLLSASWCEYFNPNNIIMLFVGRLSKEKAYERLEPIADIAKAKEAHLAIMGFGDPIFEAKIQEKYPEIIFLNTLQDQRLIGYFLRGAADIYLLTSNRETAGLVLLEGQVTGQTVFTSALLGPISLSNPETSQHFDIIFKDRDAIDNDSEFGYIDEAATRKEIYRQLTKLLAYFQGSAKTGILKNMKSNKKFAEKFTVERMLAELEVLYLASTDRRAYDWYN